MATTQEHKLIKEYDRFAMMSISAMLGLLTGVYFATPFITSGLKDSPLPEFLQGISLNLIAAGTLFITSYLTFRRVEEVRAAIQNDNLVARITHDHAAGVHAMLAEHDSAVVTQIQQSLHEAADLVDEMERAGIKTTYAFLSTPQIKRHVSSGRRIRIMQTWIEQIEDYRESLLEVGAKEGYTIQVLLLDPNSEFARQRSRDLGFSENRVPKFIQENTAVLDQLRTNHHLANLEVRYYNALPSFQLYISDNYAFFGLFPHGVWSTAAPQLGIELKRQGEYTMFGELLSSEFDRIWSRAQPERPIVNGSELTAS